jgi:hypothetical protein
MSETSNPTVSPVINPSVSPVASAISGLGAGGYANIGNPLGGAIAGFAGGGAPSAGAGVGAGPAAGPGQQQNSMLTDLTGTSVGTLGSNPGMPVNLDNLFGAGWAASAPALAASTLASVVGLPAALAMVIGLAARLPGAYASFNSGSGPAQGPAVNSVANSGVQGFGLGGLAGMAPGALNSGFDVTTGLGGPTTEPTAAAAAGGGSVAGQMGGGGSNVAGAGSGAGTGGGIMGAP